MITARKTLTSGNRARIETDVDIDKIEISAYFYNSPSAQDIAEAESASRRVIERLGYPGTVNFTVRNWVD